MASWDAYYTRFKNELLLFHRLNIYLLDREEVLRELSDLGYKESSFSNTDKEFESYLDCGRFTFTSTFEGEEENESMIDVIEVQHSPIESMVSPGDTGLSFMIDHPEEEVRSFISRNFGFSQGWVHSVCMFEGYHFNQELKDIQSRYIG